jgi:hypothetical protein
MTAPSVEDDFLDTVRIETSVTPKANVRQQLTTSMRAYLSPGYDQKKGISGSKVLGFGQLGIAVLLEGSSSVGKVASYEGDPWVGSFGALNYEEVAPNYVHEAAALLYLRGNPLVPKISDFGTFTKIDGKKRPFIVMEPVVGKTVSFESKKVTDLTLDQEERSFLVYYYLRFLIEAHRKGFVIPDRKISKEVVLTDRFGDHRKAMILDFGSFQQASDKFKPDHDLNAIKEEFFGQGNIIAKGIKERVSREGDDFIFSQEFDNWLQNGELGTGDEGIKILEKDYPMFAQSYEKTMELLKPEGLPYKPDVVQKLMEKRAV